MNTQLNNEPVVKLCAMLQVVSNEMRIHESREVNEFLNASLHDAIQLIKLEGSDEDKNIAKDLILNLLELNQSFGSSSFKELVDYLEGVK